MEKLECISQIEPLRFVPKNASPILIMIIIFNSLKTNASIFYHCSFIFRFISVMIICSNFAIGKETKSLTKYIRYVSIYTAFKAINSGHIYVFASLILFVIEVVYFAFALKMFLNIKSRERLKKKIKVNKFTIVFYHINMLFSHQLIEFFSMIFLHIGLGNKFLYKIPYSGPIKYLIATLNGIMIILLNINTVLGLLSTNFPFYTKGFTVKLNLTIKKIWLLSVLENLGFIQALELYLGSSLKIYKIIISVTLGFVIIMIFIMNINHSNFGDSLNLLNTFLLMFSLVSLVCEVILYIADHQVVDTESFLSLSGCKVMFSIGGVYLLVKLKKKLKIRKYSNYLFRIYDEKIPNSEELYDCMYYLFIDLVQTRKNQKLQNDIINIFLDHSKTCKNETCKCKLMNLVPINILSINKKDFIEEVVVRIGFFIETCITKVDYTSNYFLSLLLAEYYFIFKNNAIMSLSILNTFSHSYHNHQPSILQRVKICLLANRYAESCLVKINYHTICGFYYSLLQNKIVTKLMDKFCTIVDKQVLNKESFESGIKCSHDSYSGDVVKIHSKFLSSKNLGNIMDLLKEQNFCYKKILSSVGNYANIPTNEFPIEISMKYIFFFYLFNNGHLPTKVTENSRHLNLFKHNISLINFDTPRTFLEDMERILTEHYIKSNSSYNIVIKCMKGLKIVYFSGELYFKLGYMEHNVPLVGEEMDVLFPKELAGLHKKAMLQFLITNNNFTFTGKKYIYNYDKESVPCLIKGYAMPGLSKHLNILCRIHLTKNKRDMSFLLNEDLDLISISKGLSKAYSLSQKYINKFETNILEIFDLTNEFIDKSFDVDVKRMARMKRNINISTDNCFSKWLFHGKITEHDLIFFRRFELFDYLAKGRKTSAEEIEQLKYEVERLYTAICQEKVVINEFKEKKIKLKKSKMRLYSNLFKFLTKITDLDLYDESMKHINEAIFKIKHFINVRDGTLNQGTQINKKISRDPTNIGTLNPSNSYELTIKIRSLFGTPIFIVKIKDPQNTIYLSPKTPRNEKHGSFIKNPKGDAEEAGGEVKKERKLKQSISLGSNSKPPKTSPTMVQNSARKSTYNAAIQSRAIFTKKAPKKPKDAHRFEINYNDTYLVFFLFVALIVSITITTVLFFYQNNILSTCNLYFKILLYNMKQKDNLLNTYNSALSIMYCASEISNCAKYNINPINYFENLERNIGHFEDNYHEYYQLILKSEAMFEEISLRKSYSFNKIQKYWLQTTFESDYFNEIYYLIFQGHQCSVKENNDKDLVDKDIDMFLFNKYDNNPEAEVYSEYIKIAYYLKANFLSNYDTIFQTFTSEIEGVFRNYYKESQVKYVLVEVSGLLTYLLFFICVFIFLNKNNKIMFEHILLMYFSNHNGNKFNIETLSHNTHGENIYLRQKIKCFQSLIKSFQIENMKKFRFLKIYSSKYYENFPTSGNSVNNTLVNHTNENDTSANVSQNASQSRIGMSTTQSFLINKSQSGTKLNNLDRHFSISKPKESLFSKGTERKAVLNSTLNTSTNNATTKSLNTNSNSNSNDSSLLSISQILSITDNKGVYVIKVLILFVLVSLFIICLFFAFKTYFSLSFLTDIKYVFDDFSSYTNNKSLLYISFNTLRTMITSAPSQEMVNTFTSLLGFVSENLKQVQKLDLSRFPNMSKLAQRYNSENVDKEGVAGSFFENGVETASQAIILNIGNIFSDYEKTFQTITSKSAVVDLLSSNNNRDSLTIIDISLGFVYEQLQTEIYNAFSVDADGVRTSFKIKVDIFNIFCLVYCCLIFIIVIYWVVIFIHHKVKMIKIGSKRFGKTIRFWLSAELNEERRA